MRIGRIFDIDIVLHWTFILAPLYVLYSGWQDQADWWRMAWMQMILMAIFLFVVLHEFGHALAARGFGIGTKEIILTPIGGLAMLKTMPREPYKEMVIALAGPLVNLVLAGIVGAVILLTSRGWLPTGDGVSQTLWTLLFVNVVLFSFNLIPAFPMDGGRVLRAFLAMWFDYRTATQYATSVARFAAISFMVYGFLRGELSWILIGGFVYLASSAELARLVMQQELERKAMFTGAGGMDGRTVQGHVVRSSED